MGLTTQFTVYTSEDEGSPILSATAGTLLTLLDAVLVGTAGVAYGSKASAGWTKPIANSGNCGHYKQGAGNGYHLFVNDNNPVPATGPHQVWLTGWETMTGIAAPVGAGAGQFPQPAQNLTNGHVMARKSATSGSTFATWVIFADSRTFYCWTQYASGANPATYNCFGFGDIYQYSTDGVGAPGGCCLFGYPSETTTTGTWEGQVSRIDQASGGIFVARPTMGGVSPANAVALGGSTNVGRFGFYQASSASGLLYGNTPLPNPPDRSIVLTPIGISEPPAAIRGRFRGLYHVQHPQTAFCPGYTFCGMGDSSGKSFTISPFGAGSGYWAIETSATVEANF